MDGEAKESEAGTGGFDLGKLGDSWGATIEAKEQTGEVVDTIGRGRPKKSGGSSAGSKKSAQSSRSVDGSDLQPIIRAAGKIGTRLAKVDGLKPEEITELSDATAAVFEKYGFFEAANKYAPEVGLGISLFSIVEPRVDQALAAKRAESEKSERLSDLGPEIRDEF